MRDKFLLTCALLCVATGAESAPKDDADSLRDKNGEPVQAGVFTSRWGRLFSGNEDVFSGALSFSSGLKEQWMTIPNSSDTAEQKRKYNQTLNLSLQYSPYSYWFANVTSRLPVTDTSRYTADFRYSFGYDDWHANTFSLVYSNYGDNRFWTSGNRRHTYFEQGAVTLAYKFSLPKPIENTLLINKGDSIICQMGYSWVPRYYDLDSNDIRKNKNVVLGGVVIPLSSTSSCAPRRSGFRTAASNSPGTATTAIVLAMRVIRQVHSLFSMLTTPAPVTPVTRAAAVNSGKAPSASSGSYRFRRAYVVTARPDS